MPVLSHKLTLMKTKPFILVLTGCVLLAALSWRWPNRSTKRPAAMPASAPAPAAPNPDPESTAKEADPQTEPHPRTYFGKGSPTSVSQLPPSPLRTQLEKLAPEARKRALAKLAKTEFHSHDLNSLRVDDSGAIFYVCSLTPDPGAPETSEAESLEEVSSESEISASEYTSEGIPVLHSKSGSDNVLYLDFNGGLISGTAWNDWKQVAEWDCKEYDTDDDTSTFSSSEQATIIAIWERMAEDYAPFDIDVTTEEPDVWTSTTLHALITADVDYNGVECPHYGYGGIAYVDIFDSAYTTSRSPVWIQDYNAAQNVAAAASHEIGHNLGLSHDGNLDGTSTNQYYSGHANGSISWAPIMGSSYDRTITQWSQGEYYNASNPQDDLAILSAYLGYDPDDHGDSTASATFLISTDTTNLSSSAVIETTGDPDLFSFITAAGTVAITSTPYRADSGTWGGNSDLALILYRADGTMITSNNPVSSASANIEIWLDAGTYYVEIRPVGLGNPYASTPTGYTSYGSLGQYTLTGAILSDRDGDEIPDSWEELYFQNITNALTGADSDDDGQDNWSEYVTGTDPTDFLSCFTVEGTVTNDQNSAYFALTFPTIANRSYSIQNKASLDVTDWSTLTNLTGFDGETEHLHLISTNLNFYRVGVEFEE